jgi:phosphopantetheine adenylyltransferase
MEKLAINKLELLLKDLKDMQDLEKETGRQYFNTQLFAIRVKEIYKILKEESDVNESN